LGQISGLKISVPNIPDKCKTVNYNDFLMLKSLFSLRMKNIMFFVIVVVLFFVQKLQRENKMAAIVRDGE